MQIKSGIVQHHNVQSDLGHGGYRNGDDQERRGTSIYRISLNNSPGVYFLQRILIPGYKTRQASI